MKEFGKFMARNALPLACLLSGIWVVACGATAAAQTPIPIAQLQRAEPVNFDREVLPILQKKCLACHSASERQGALVLENPPAMLKGGDSGAAVMAGKSGESLLLQLASHAEEPFMPPPDNDVAAEPLTSAELGLIKLWIDQGAKGTAGSGALSPTSWRPLPPGVNPIYAVAVTADGQYAACSRANQIFIYHVPSGQLVTRLTDPELQARSTDNRAGEAHLDLVQSLSFNADGDMLASGGFRVAKLWQRPSDVVRIKLDTGQQKVTAVAVSPDRSLLAVGADKVVKLWNLADGKPAATLEGHAGEVTGLRFTADGTRLVSAAQDNTLRVWQVADGQLVSRLDTAGPVQALELVNKPLPQEQAEDAPAPLPLIATVGDDNFIQIWNFPPAAIAPQLEVPEKPTALAASADRQLLAVANAAGLVRVLDVAGQTIGQWQAHEVAVHAMAFHPLAAAEEAPQKLLATAAADGTVRLWNFETGEPAGVYRGSLAPVQSIAFRADGKQLVAGAADGNATVWNLEAAELREFAEAPHQPAAVAVLSNDGKRLATIGSDSDRPAIFVHDVASGQRTHTLLGHQAAVRAVAFSPDGAKLVSGSADKTARVWDLADSKFPELVQFAGHAGEVTAVALNADATQVVSGASDKTLKLWNVADAQEAQNFAGHAGAVVGVAFVAGNQVASASADKTIRIWNPAGGNQVRAVTDPAALLAMGVSSDGARLAVACADKALRVYQVANGQRLAECVGHAAPPAAVCFNADGTRLVSSAADHTAIVWDAQSGRLLELLPDEHLVAATRAAEPDAVLLVRSEGPPRHVPQRFALALVGNTDKLTAVAFHPNGQVVYTACVDGNLRAFNATNGQAGFTRPHGAAVHGMALSSNGALLASAGEDKTVKLFNAANGAPAQPPQLTGFQAPVSSVTFAAADAKVVGGSSAGEVLVFDLAAQGLEQAFVGHTGPARTLVAAGDGRDLVTLSDDQTVRRWRLLAERRLAGHTQPITSLAAVTTQPLQLVSGSQDGTSRHWNLENGAQIRQFNHGAPVTGVAVRPDGQRLASASANKTLRLWNFTNGAQIKEMKGDIRALALVTKLTQRDRAATTQRDVAKAKLEAAEKLLPTKQEAAKKAEEALAAANKKLDEQNAVLKKATDEKAAAEKVAIEAAAAAQKAALAKTEADSAAAEAAAGAKLAASRSTRLAALAQRFPDDEAIATASQQAQQEAADLMAKAQSTAAAQSQPSQAADQAAKAANDAATKATATQKPYNDAMTAVGQAETEQNAASQVNAIAQRELEIVQADVPAAKKLLETTEAALAEVKKELETAQQAAAAAEMPIQAVAFSPDGSQLASGGDSAVVHLWDGETGVATASYVGHQGPVGSLTFTSDEALASGAAEQAVLVWELNPPWRLHSTIGAVDAPQTLVNRVLAVDFSRDGNLLATASGEPSRSGHVKIWNVADGKLVANFENAHDDAVLGVRFSPDGKRIASCGADKYIRTFDLESGELLRRYEGHTHHVLGVTWKGDGSLLASAGADSVVKIWNAETGDQTRTIGGFNKQVTSVRFVGDTVNLITGSGDRIVRICRSDNGGTVRNFGGAADFVYCVDITPDNATVVAGCHDSVLRIWNGANGQLLHSLEPPAIEVAGGEKDDQVATSK